MSKLRFRIAIDEMQLHWMPTIRGAGERLFEGVTYLKFARRGRAR